MNKKLIKLLACSACGLGIASSIPFMTTSCGCAQKEVDLPDEVYEYANDDRTIISGFKKNIDWSKYTNCNTMLIPGNATKIADYAFGDDHTQIYKCEIYSSPFIPIFLKTLKFSNNDNEIILGDSCFAFNHFVNIYLPNKFVLTKENFTPVFACSQNLKHIYLNEDTQDKYVYSKSFGNKCQIIVEKNTNEENQTFAGVVGGLATGFVDFTKDRKITQIGNQAFRFCSSIYGYRISRNITSIGMDAFGHNTGLDVNQLSFEEGNTHYGFATNLGKNARYLVEATGTGEDLKFEFNGQSNVANLIAGDIDYTNCDAEPVQLYWCSVSTIIFNSYLIHVPIGGIDPYFLCGNKQLKSITFKYGIIDDNEQKLTPSVHDFCSNPNLEYIEFNGYHTDIDGFRKNFVLSDSDETCFDYIGRGGKIKALDCGFSSNKLLNYLKDNTQTDWNPFKDWEAID